ncbi:MAG: glutathione synthase [Vulcanimicrobiota bacterium]
MIVIMGDIEEPMIEDTLDELEERGAPHCYLAPDHFPQEATLSLALSGSDSGIQWRDGTRVRWSEVRSVYHRLSFDQFRPQEDQEAYSVEEEAYASNEFMSLLNPILNTLPARIVNRPMASSTNASKPFQANLIQQAGFSIPETLVTNDPEAAREFYDLHGGQVIYKSISYVRSIVKQMTPEDLGRLDTLRTCPVQLQQMVPGIDHRVHVMGERVFAHRIQAEENDYRYDKQAEIVAFELDEETEERCLDLTQILGMEIAGVDLRISPEGEVFCFEVNPSPAFSWYEARTGQPITAALCDLLMKEPN